jgi:sec-independent protein translocase protein TatC
MTGFILGSPWIFYQIWMFVAAGLYPHEKKYVNYFLPFSLALFLAGVIVCEWFVMTRAVAALLYFNEWLGFAPDLRLNEWLGFAIFMPLVFGICFQTPLVMLFVQRIGVLTVDAFRKFRRIAWFSLAVFAAVITPDPSPISMMFLWIPMSLLYELGIFLCVYLPGKPLLEFGVPDSDELVEV